MVVGMCGHLEVSAVSAEGWGLCGPGGVQRNGRSVHGRG